jgi:4-hydroxyacetophenone monooxygenase
LDEQSTKTGIVTMSSSSVPDLKNVHLPSLMMAIVHLTGDTSLLSDEYRPSPSLFGDQNSGGLAPDKQERVREMARVAIDSFLRGGQTTPPTPSDASLRRMVRFMLGNVSDEQMPYALDALCIDGVDRHRPDPRAVPLASKSTLPPGRVIVVGAGMSGLLAAIRLQQAGFQVEVIEKNPEVGGTWFENSYPGCRVDTENHSYSYSFEPNAWPQHYSTQPVVLDYFKRIASKYNLRPHIRFETKVEEARFDETRAVWCVTLRRADGETQLVEADALISAVGQLNQPKLPDIPGRETFAGPSFHSAQWDHGVALAGQRVAVIGTGASAFQFIPRIAADAAKLSVFQRSSTYFAPTPEYHHDVGASQRWLLDHMPFYRQWYRLWLFWLTGSDLTQTLLASDPNWNRSDSVNAASLHVRQMLLDALSQKTGVGALFKALTPDIPLFGKRPCRDNGDWVRTLTSEHVELVTSQIKEITADGITTVDATRHVCDVIIYGTGFHASDFLRTMRVVGRNGEVLSDKWAGDARAFLGMMVPGFPNFFMLYGPNTNLVANGSVIFFSERSVNYVVQCLQMRDEGGYASVEVRQSSYEDFNRRADEAGATRPWAKVPSWYVNERGRSAQNWPFTQFEFWKVTDRPNPDDLMFEAMEGSQAQKIPPAYSQQGCHRLDDAHRSMNLPKQDR